MAGDLREELTIKNLPSVEMVDFDTLFRPTLII
jgi:hypothetical protein